MPILARSLSNDNRELSIYFRRSLSQQPGGFLFSQNLNYLLSKSSEGVIVSYPERICHTSSGLDESRRSAKYSH